MLNMNFAARVVIQTDNAEWVSSPSPSVLRKPLAREGLEHGHATSLVTYKPGATFAEHSHPFGEEIYVLEGIFSDENGYDNCILLNHQKQVVELLNGNIFLVKDNVIKFIFMT